MAAFAIGACDTSSEGPADTCAIHWREGHYGSALAAGAVAVDGGALVLSDSVPRDPNIFQSGEVVGLWLDRDSNLFGPHTERFTFSSLAFTAPAGSLELILTWSMGVAPAVVHIDGDGAFTISMTGEDVTNASGKLSRLDAGVTVELAWLSPSLAVEARVIDPDGSVVVGRRPYFNGGMLTSALRLKAPEASGSATARLDRFELVGNGSGSFVDDFDCLSVHSY
ncbi:MAG: hypothetical protein U1F43_11240 [Myxococcota bacterium]